MSKTTLYTITADYQKIIDEYEQAEELTPELEAQLAINESQLQSKSIAYLSVIKQRTAFISTIDDEIKRLQQLKKQQSTLVSNLKERLLNAVKTFGDFECGVNKFGTRKSSSVQVEDVNALPDEFKTIKITESANKAELKRAIKAGESIQGVELIESLNLKIN